MSNKDSVRHVIDGTNAIKREALKYLNKKEYYMQDNFTISTMKDSILAGIVWGKQDIIWFIAKTINDDTN